MSEQQVPLHAPRADVIYSGSTGTPYQAGGDGLVLVWPHDVEFLKASFGFTDPSDDVPKKASAPKAKAVAPAPKKAASTPTKEAASAPTQPAPKAPEPISEGNDAGGGFATK